MQHKLKLDGEEENTPSTVHGILGPNYCCTGSTSTQPLSTNSLVDPATSVPISPPPQTSTTGGSRTTGAAHRDNELQRQGQQQLSRSPPPTPASTPISDTDTDDEEAEWRESDNEPPPLDGKELYSQVAIVSDM